MCGLYRILSIRRCDFASQIKSVIDLASGWVGGIKLKFKHCFHQFLDYFKQNKMANSDATNDSTWILDEVENAFTFQKKLDKEPEKYAKYVRLQTVWNFH